jgi:ubiquinone/menaquinone biosynthesis C-methylase UbiE
MRQAQRDETGQCIVCGRESKFRFDPTIITAQLRAAWGISDGLVEAFNRKESMFCSSCGASLRIRRLATVLVQTFKEINGSSCESVAKLVQNDAFRHLKIAEITACGALHSCLKDHPNLYYSEWLPHAKPGEVHKGIRCEDLQRLTYPDDFFDIILTSETLEHVPDPDRAWREIHRTLKDGGCHIFTIPVVPSQRDTIQRARMVNGVRENLLRPVYHSPWGREDVFVYTDFGMDIVEKLDSIGLKTDVFYLNREDELDVAAVFRSRKYQCSTFSVPRKEEKMLQDTGGRYLPWMEDAAIAYEHLHRYAYAAQFVQNKKVLDLACGEGYGSHLLARTADVVVGIDSDRIAIKQASNKYIRRNLQFKVGSLKDVPIKENNIFEVIVCFDALENVEDHSKLLEEVKRLLTLEGLLIVSTPNRWAHGDDPQSKNPFHLHGLYFDEFKALLQKHFGQVKFLGHRVDCNSNIWPIFPQDKTRVVEYVVERNPTEFVFVEREKKRPLYIIALASDSQEEIEEKASLLVDVSNELFEQNNQQRAQLAAELHELTQKAAQLNDTVQKQQHEIEALRRSLAKWQQGVTHLSAEWLPKFAAGNRYLPTPPLEMIRHVGSVNEENFREVGMHVVCDLIQFGLLTNPNATIADIGCGCGRIAMFIVPALGDNGSYHGFDTWSEGIKWATENITSNYPNAVFKTLPDTQKDAGYRADFFHSIDLADNSCDLVLAISLFTHLKYDAARSFMQEIYRIMRKDARAYLTFFIYDEESLHAIPYPHRDLDSDGYGFYYVEGSYANSYFMEKTILDLLLEFGYTLDVKQLGFWRGDKYKDRWPVGYQDLFILGKA